MDNTLWLIGSFIVNTLLGVAMYLLKDAHQETKSRIRVLEEQAVRKDDYKEFKEDVSKKIDKIDTKLDQVLQHVGKHP